MKIPAFVFLLLAVACGGIEAEALGAAGRNYASDISVDADVRADFFKRYPDLQDEDDTVTAAARDLALDGTPTGDDKKTAELLARRTRALLERRTPQEWQRKAVSLFPELGVAGSEFNLLFLRHVKELQQSSPQFMKEPSWPVLLARRCADELQPKAPLAATPVSPSGPAPASAASVPSGRRSAWWISSLSLLLLLAIVVQPARFLFRCRRAFAGSGGPLTLWQAALGPTAWAYLAVALIALVRTFLANSDQKFYDQFGITLLVSVVAGVVVALPAYGLSLGGMWWWRHRTPPAPKAADHREMRETTALPVGGRKP